MTKNAKTEAVLNREYKDSLFRLVFGQPEKMIELYNAIFDTNYPPDTKIDINTIEEVFYKTQKNDISFTIDGTYIMLSEHQSTINPNMPLRDMMYILEIWKGMFKTEQLYKRKLITLPQPKFVVLYNGTEPMPPVSELNLSDCFLGDDNPLLNLKVLVYNVNEGMNCELMRKSATLQQYSHLIALFRDYQAKGPITSQVIEEIMGICLAEGILVDLVEKHGKTLLDFLHFEISQEEVLEMSREDGYEAGFEKGHSDGFSQGLSQGLSQGISQGISQGLSQGITQGISQGQERVNKLIEKLAEEGRFEDLQKSATDPEYQQQLFEEFEL